MMLYSTLSVALWSLLVFLPASSADTSCDACKFDGNDTDDCKVYGVVNGELIAWSKGSQDCKDTYNIKISSIDPEASCSSVNAFVNSLRFGDLSTSTAKLGLGESEGDFFQDGNGGTPVLKDEIVIDGTTYDCKQSEADCYNAMKSYFETEPGKTEMMQVCDTLYDKVALDMEQEESTLRIRLCQEVQTTTVSAVCEPLAGQVEEQMTKLSGSEEIQCSSLGFGPGETEIPGCTQDENGQGDTNSDADTEEEAGTGQPTSQGTTSYAVKPKYCLYTMMTLAVVVATLC